MYHILIADKLGEAGLADLAAAPDVTFDVKTDLGKEELLAIIADYDALIVRSGTRVDADLLAAATRLKVIGRAGVGVDNIDLDAATAHDIVVLNTPRANTIATAEHTLALMLALSRHVVPAHTALAGGQWQRTRFVGVELYGKTVGIVGFGRVGREVAKRARAFGMNVLVHHPNLEAQVAAAYEVEVVALDSLLARADYVTLHASVTPETKGMINADALAELKEGAVLINVARGALVDERAVHAALLSGKLKGAALDVYTNEPPGPEHPLIGMDNVLHTPHLGASTREAQHRASTQVVDQILDLLRGQQAQHTIND